MSRKLELARLESMLGWMQYDPAGDIVAVRRAAQTLDSFLINNPAPADTQGRWPLGGLAPTENVVAALRYLGHRVTFGDSTACSTAASLTVRSREMVQVMDARILVRIRALFPRAVTISWLWEQGRWREEPWALRGSCERLQAAGELKLAVKQPPEVWRLTTASERNEVRCQTEGNNS